MAPFNLSKAILILTACWGTGDNRPAFRGVKMNTSKIIMDGAANEFEIAVCYHFTGKTTADIMNKKFDGTEDLFFLERFER
eukprot:12952498-Ditylum_brightwellii.AAC.1